MNDITFMTTQQLATLIRERRVSTVEVLEAYLAQIAQHNPTLNAIVTLDEEGARQRAQAADAALMRNEVWGPLHGVPITLEDAHATAGLRATWGGYPPLATHVPSKDSSVAARLQAAGAILLGKTHGPAIWEESVFGRTNNPWDLTRTSGGSSAGPAAALAAGLTALDVGLDTVGSIQNPAHYCGIFGMRPTEHRIPLTGVFFIDSIRKFRIMSVTGPMARSVQDLRLALQIISGPDGRDTDVPPLPWHEIARPAGRGLRIAWVSTFPDMPITHEICTRIEKLAQELEQLGIQMDQCLPQVDFLAQAQLAKHLFSLLATALEFRGSLVDPQTDGRPSGSLGDYLTALHLRDSFMTAWEEFFTKWDALVCPAGPITAERHSDIILMVDGVAVPDDQVELLGIPYSLSPVSGCPTVVIPLAQDHQGLPFGVQVMGRRWEDERLLAIAELLSEVTGGFQRPPGY